ncbi:gliding motility lipoprotein GldH [Cochleicola gelatinilyticus]|uniref:Gliding motility lipoprotein GldH n=1 Tax=Cochleicola gelatinilyticus TaxID=1763537 RepID=A0A167IZX2_9FLAO|nr:gliding motility lipoprotein GldH [Cochleicola gelatinilyticus]OAB80182.1 gliding motility lipoprotein GldH [Cochleicola gelatinilyticus]
MRNLCAAFLGSVLLFSCNSDVLVSDSESISGTWNKNEAIVFTIPQIDSSQSYDVFLTLRNNNDYPFSNLFLVVSMEFPHGKIVKDTLEYKMANPDGSWIGEGIGSIKESKLIYKKGVSFSEEGTYKISITQAVRNNGNVEGVTQLEGITDVGYSIETTSQH